MNQPMRLSDILVDSLKQPEEQLAVFALINLGLIESLGSGVLTATDAVRYFYNLENCLFVRKRIRNKLADRIMSHGVQLPDLFDSLPAEEAHREFQRELSMVRTLCLKMLETSRQVA